MDAQPHQQGESGSKSSRLAGAASNTSLIGTQQECRQQLVHHDFANAASRNMTQDAYLKIVHKTGSSKNKYRQAFGCNYMHIVVNSHQVTISRTVGVLTVLQIQWIAVHNRKHPWSIKECVHTVHKMEHYDVISPGIFGDEFADTHPHEWTKQSSTTLEETTEAYMVEIITDSHCFKQQLISCRFSTCLLLGQGKEVGYSWNSLTCTCPWIWPNWPKVGFRAPQ